MFDSLFDLSKTKNRVDMKSPCIKKEITFLCEVLTSVDNCENWTHQCITSLPLWLYSITSFHSMTWPAECILRKIEYYYSAYHQISTAKLLLQEAVNIPKAYYVIMQLLVITVAEE